MLRWVAPGLPAPQLPRVPAWDRFSSSPAQTSLPYTVSTEGHLEANTEGLVHHAAVSGSNFKVPDNSLDTDDAAREILGIKILSQSNLFCKRAGKSPRGRSTWEPRRFEPCGATTHVGLARSGQGFSRDGLGGTGHTASPSRAAAATGRSSARRGASSLDGPADRAPA